jgi:VWFA-related protein
MNGAKLFATVLSVQLLLTVASVPLNAEPARPEPTFCGPIPDIAAPSDADSSAWTVAKALPAGYTIRRTVPEVHLQFTVSDERGRPLTGLSRDDFRVFDDCLPVSKIRDFSRLDDLPLDIGIMLDVSDSVKRTVATQRHAIQFIFSHLFHPETDRAFLATFSQDARIWQEQTNNRDALERALEKIQQQGWATYLYDSLRKISMLQFQSEQESYTAQRILLLISDGEDTGSLHSLRDAISAAQSHEIQIYALAVHPPQQSSRGDRILKALAESTGGEFYVLSKEKEFSSVFSAMEQQMRTQYLLSFQPIEPKNGFHSVEIQMAIGPKFHVHAKQGYYFDGN